MIAHGVQTTTIEIDPLVHRYATKYFQLPPHNVVISDAIPAVKAMQTSADNKTNFYDYIIHDVFTGGVEPLELFTIDFLTDLYNLLSSEGTIAINYAGDLNLPTAASFVRTVLAVFPICGMYRESAPLEPEEPEEDFTNAVLFCRKEDAAFSFREPTEKDFLGSQARRDHLLPKLQVLIDKFLEGREEAPLITKETMKGFKKAQEKSQRGHWHVMRGVVPDSVWENW